MAAKHKITVSSQPTNHRPSSAERRAAEIASLSTRQGELKREAAERRAQRANKSVPAPPPGPRKVPTARRSNSR
jgi:hypothetical protein